MSRNEKSNGPNRDVLKCWTAGSASQPRLRCRPPTPTRRRRARARCRWPARPGVRPSARRRSRPAGRASAAGDVLRPRRPARRAAPPRAAPSPRSCQHRDLGAPGRCRTSGMATADAGGGSSITDRDRARIPVAVQRPHLAQLTPPGGATSQGLGSSGGEGVDAPGAAPGPTTRIVSREVAIRPIADDRAAPTLGQRQPWRRPPKPRAATRADDDLVAARGQPPASARTDPA